MNQPQPGLPMVPSTLKTLLLLASVFILYLLLHVPPPHVPQLLLPELHEAATAPAPVPTSSHHLLFAIASSAGSLRRRAPYLRLWSTSARAILFLDSPPPPDFSLAALPPIAVSSDTSRFPYTFPLGLPSAVRVARIVKEAVDRNESDVRWFVFGDDDTIFFVDNLVRTLSKYDHDRWFYVGSNSESYEQNESGWFDMAFGGGGFALSHSLAKVLAGVLDSCLMRYPHLFGSDARIFSCLAELGVGLTHEPGFHQVDIRGNLFGMLSAHPLSPLLSLHHLDSVDSFFPNMNKSQALEHLFKAVNIDPARILQQTVCYDRLNLLTISVAWGFSIQVFEGNLLLPDLLPLQRTFSPWRRGKNIGLSRYMFNTREYPKDPCKRAAVFFLQSVGSNDDGVWSNYTRNVVGNCEQTGTIKNLEQIRVFSQKLKFDIEQMKAPRRQCCSILSTFNKSMVLGIRQCGVDELISMHL